MQKRGFADLPLHNGSVPQWLSQRMAKLGLAITESVITEYGEDEMIKRLSDPFWFQSFGAVMGMDWHSSGITTSVMAALKSAINPVAKELGLYICGGKGRFSTETPNELLKIGERTGLPVQQLIRCSKLTAKVDNTAVQDGYQLYLHSFVLNRKGHWAVVQQGMNPQTKMARRYHWHSDLQSFTQEPHTGICGVNHGHIFNLTATEAAATRASITSITRQNPDLMVQEVQHLLLPAHHDVRSENVDLKKLGAALWLAHENASENFEELLLLKGVGPRTIQSLALVSEVIHGTPSRFRDPARFSFAHGGKDGHPFPVPLNTYDEVIRTLQRAVSKAKLGEADKSHALKKLHSLALSAEKDFQAGTNIDVLIEKERSDSWRYGGRTVHGKATKRNLKGLQMRLF